MIDIGANLTHDSFDADREDVIARAQAAGVKRFIVTGSTEAGSQAAAELAAQYPDVLYATAGVHPHHATEYSADVEDTLRTLLANPLVVAVGECGLDYFRNFSPIDAQIAAFERQLELAVEVQKPVFLHQRDAHDDFLRVLSRYLDRLPACVAHCFTGDETQLRDYLERGLYIGITGWICDERRGSHLQGLIPLIPEDRLMIETDAPYLMPRTLKPKPKTRRNEPEHLVEVLRVVAAAADSTPAVMAARTTANAERFFRL